jgi:DsbC/DsbD-like thiol-disulfide interchange protein
MRAMKRLAAVALVVCAAGVSAQDLPSSVQDTKHLTLKASTAAVAGKRVTLAVDVTPKPKMHVYAPGQAGYIGVTLTLDANPAVSAAKPKYPAAEKIYLPALKETQLVYAKPFRIAQEVTLRSTASSSVTITGTLRYQACDDAICYVPTTVPVAWTVGGK